MCCYQLELDLPDMHWIFQVQRLRPLSEIAQIPEIQMTDKIVKFKTHI